jgi:hypothetical protein
VWEIVIDQEGIFFNNTFKISIPQWLWNSFIAEINPFLTEITNNKIIYQCFQTRIVRKKIICSHDSRVLNVPHAQVTYPESCLLHRGFLLPLLFYVEDGGDKFHRNSHWFSPDYGVFGGQSGTRADFLRVFRSSLRIIIPLISPSLITRSWHNRPIGGRSAEWTQLDSTPHYTN